MDSATIRRLPCDNAKIIAPRFRTGKNYILVTEIKLVEDIIKRETLKSNLYINSINSEVKRVWNLLTPTQQKDFETLAEVVNEINYNNAQIINESHEMMKKINN